MGEGAAPDNMLVATEQFQNMCNTVVEMGLVLAPVKCEGPRKIMSWTGTTFNNIEFKKPYVLLNSFFKVLFNFHSCLCLVAAQDEERDGGGIGLQFV